MVTRSKVPSWIQRRCSGRPVARWIAWSANRSVDAKTPVETVCREATLAEPVHDGNVVWLFRKSA